MNLQKGYFSGLAVACAIAIVACYLLSGCGAHAPRPVPATSPIIQHFEGEVQVSFMGGPWLPDGEVALANAAHDAVFGLIKLKTAQIRAENPGTQILSGRAWGGKVVRRDSSGTTYVLVKYEAEVEIPLGKSADALAFVLPTGL